MNKIFKSSKAFTRRLLGQQSSGGLAPYEGLRSSAGFTIIETLIAMLLFAISLLGGIAVYYNASAVNTMAVHKKIATEIAGSTMEKLRRAGYVDFCIGYGNLQGSCESGPPPLENAPTVGKLPASQIVTFSDILPSGVPADYRVATVTLTWTESSQSGPRNIVMTSYAAP